MKPNLFPLAVAAAFLMPPSRLNAAPYASAVTETDSSVSFVLNETADSVKVIFDEGARTLDITPPTAGTKTFSKAGFTTYRIDVEKVAGPGWKSGVLQQLSDDTNTLVKFANGRGVSVNRKPDSGKFFGRVYVSVGSVGTAAPVTVPPTATRATSDGIYVLNADMTVTSLGATPIAGIFASTATGGTNSPYRVTVGDKGDLFIADWSDLQGSVYKTNGDVAGAVNVLGGPAGSGFPVTNSKIHGSIAAVATTGTVEAGDLRLWTLDEDLQDDRISTAPTQRNSVWEWNQGGDPLPLNNTPARIITTSISDFSQTCDLARGSDGYLYKSQYRSAGNESGVVIVNPNGVPNPGPGVVPGTVRHFSRTAWQDFLQETTAVDPLLGAVACDISEDNWLAVSRLPDNAIQLVKIQDGKFDFSKFIILDTSPTTTQSRDISFDIAGNLYTLSSGQALLRVYSRGGHTLAKTFSNGTFEITEPTAPLPPPAINPYPFLRAVSTTGSDFLIDFTSRVGRPESHVVQTTRDLENGPWLTLVNPAAPNPAVFSIIGDPPTYRARIIGGFNPAEPRFFFRVKRN